MVLPGLSQDAEDLPHLAQGATPGLVDPIEGRPGRRRVRLQPVLRDCRLDHDRAHMVRDHVMELASDPQALLAYGAVCEFQTRRLECDRLGCQTLGVGSTCAHRISDEPHAAGDQGRADDV